MTFVSNFSRGLTLGALAMGLTIASVNAQAGNGTNYHVLSNGLDVIYGGLGAGGTQTKADGVGTWIAGEDLRGSHLVAFSGDFGYRNSKFREDACPLKNPIVGTLAIQFRGISFTEIDGLNGNKQQIFTDPKCTSPSFPLGGSAGFIPFGTFGSGGFSFGIFGLPAGVGPAPSSAIVLPNNGLIPSSSAGTATVVGAASNVSLPINSTGFCWGVQFAWLPSSLALTDDIDGLWHYTINGDGNNEYWGFSNNEMNIWASNSINSDAGLTALVPFLANADYDLLMASVEPNTTVSLAPRGLGGGGPYYTQTENVRNENGVILNPNHGFDVGRGSAAISFSGTAGVPNPTSGVGNQNATNAPGTVTTLGFATWDNGGDFNGSVRLTWVSIDFLGAAGANPSLDPGITKFAGNIRVPVVSAGLLQPLTSICFKLFGHATSTTASGWPDAGGFPSGAFNTPAVGGASWQFPTGPQPAACVGAAINLTYGTSGRNGAVGSAGGLQWNPSVADTSGTKQLFLFN